MKQEVRVAIAGVGGYAGNHHAAIRALEATGRCRLVATCDPNPTALAEASEKFGFVDRGVRCYSDLHGLLSETPVDLVTLPTPIPLHAAQHRMVVEAGAACYLEKPPTLDWREYQGMLEVEEKARFKTNVGFNFVADPMRRKIKERLQRGEFGPLESASMMAVWPRNLGYYQRNRWAGRRMVDGQPVMDSPIGNAVAHFVQDMLFFADSEPIKVQSWTLKAHDIESFDTCFIEATLESGIPFRIAVTHTGVGASDDVEVLVCRDATIRFPAWHWAQIDWRDGRVDDLRSEFADYGQVLASNLSLYLDYLEGKRSGPVTSLEACRGFVLMSALTQEAWPEIPSFDPARVVDGDDGYRNVPGLDLEMDRFVDEGIWPKDAEVRTAQWSDLPC